MAVFVCHSCGAKQELPDEGCGEPVRCFSCQVPMNLMRGRHASDAITAAAPHWETLGSPAATADDARRTSSQLPSMRRSWVSRATVVPFLLGAATGFALFTLVGLLLPAIQKVRAAAAQVEALNHMKNIGLAVHRYHDSQRFLPTPNTLDPRHDIKGQLVDLSWRVMLLPHLNEQSLFETFNSKAPWDDARNSAQLSSMPVAYHDPFRLQDAKATATYFQYFTGPGTLWPTSNERRRLIDISDGTSNTFLFAESMSPVPWSMPTDIFVPPIPPGRPQHGVPIFPLPPVPAVPAGPVLPLPPEVFLVGFADTSARAVDRRKANDATLRTYIGPADQMVVLPLD